MANDANANLQGGYSSSNIKDYLSFFQKILKPETSFYIICIIYGVGISVLTLAIPISVQALVNTVTFGVLVQPLVIISIVLLSLLGFSGVLNALQTYMIELFQRRFYARISGDIVVNILNADYEGLRKKNAVNIINKYFDVMTVQKSLAIILTDGTALILQTMVGLLLLAFYHPYFLVFDLLLVSFLILVWSIYGKDALKTAIDESKAKYETAKWMQEIARNNLFFKSNTRKLEALKTSNAKIEDYLEKRSIHFRKLFAQNILLLAIYALMSAIVLGLGGYLVIEGQLTLGQLVAAELIVTIILSALAKAGKYLEKFYDLYAATEKLSQFYDIKQLSYTESQLKASSINEFEHYDLDFRNVDVVSQGKELKINYRFEYGKKYRIFARTFSAKVMFNEICANYYPVRHGSVMFGDLDYSELTQFCISDFIYSISEPTYFDGSILDNLRFVKPDASIGEIMKVLEVVELDHVDGFLEDGIDTIIRPSGYPLWSSQVIRFEVAKAILAEPKVILLYDVFEQVEGRRQKKIIDYLFSKNVTLITFTEGGCKNVKFDAYLSLDNDGIKEYKSEAELLENENK